MGKTGVGWSNIITGSHEQDGVGYGVPKTAGQKGDGGWWVKRREGGFSFSSILMGNSLPPQERAEERERRFAPLVYMGPGKAGSCVKALSTPLSQKRRQTLCIGF